MPTLAIPRNQTQLMEAHLKWLKLLKDAQDLVDSDEDLQVKAAQGLRLKERHVPVDLLGRMYGQYCDILNRLHDVYLTSLQIQKAPYILEIVNVVTKRIFELRTEMVNLILNDYVYVDGGLVQARLTPDQIQIVIPYHYPLECRAETSEKLLQIMWAEARVRKNEPTEMVTPIEVTGPYAVSNIKIERNDSSSEDAASGRCTHTSSPEQFKQACVIHRHERFRQYFLMDHRSKCNMRRTYFLGRGKEVPLELKIKAATLIQKSYRVFMKIKRERASDTRRDMLLGLIPDPWCTGFSYEDESNKVYERRRRTRSKLQEVFLRELEKEKMRLLVFKKEDQIDDITEEIREWFKEWFYGYGFLPEFPYPLEGGTMMLVRGDYPTIEEKKEADERSLAATKGKTKEQLKQEEKQAKADAAARAELAREQKKKDAELLMKLKCNPLSDPGYQLQTSDNQHNLVEAFQKYRSAWSLLDKFPESNGEGYFGFLKEFLTEDLMSEIHRDCRKYVDELLRLDLKILIKMQQLMYKRVGWKYPKMSARIQPKAVPIPKTLTVDSDLLKEFEPLFDLGIITKPTAKLKDVFGDTNYAAYDFNIRDPKATFPLPAYGDVRRRLVYSCIYGIGINHGATRNKSVMLLGPARNGKSFLVDVVAGELNAVKIDISPEVFGAHIRKPAKLLSKVFYAAKVFEPTVIFLKNVERVFAKKLRPEDKEFNCSNIKSILPKHLKSISNDDKIIFIATCTEPWLAHPKLLVANFNEIILVPRTDYGSLQRFFYQKFQSIRSMPRDYNVNALSQLLQGYGFGLIVELYDNIMNSERIVRLNIEPLSPLEFLEPLIERQIEPVTLEDYQRYVQFFIENSSLKTRREEYAVINAYREVMYRKIGEQKRKKDQIE